MKPHPVRALAVVLCVVSACRTPSATPSRSTRGTAPAVAPSPGGLTWEPNAGPLAIPREARRLCQTQAAADAGNPGWSAYALTQPTATVVSAFHTRQPTATAPDPEHLKIHGPNGQSLLVFPVGEVATHPHCDTAPQASDHTVVMVLNGR